MHCLHLLPSTLGRPPAGGSARGCRQAVVFYQPCAKKKKLLSTRQKKKKPVVSTICWLSPATQAAGGSSAPPLRTLRPPPLLVACGTRIPWDGNSQYHRCLGVWGGGGVNALSTPATLDPGQAARWRVRPRVSTGRGVLPASNHRVLSSSIPSHSGIP